MYLKYILSYLLIVLFSLNIFATNLNVTNITRTNNNIDIEFNKTLKLCNFTLIDNNLISPSYETKRTKYYFFYFLNRDFKNKIINEINNSEIAINNLNGKIEYKINKCNIVKNKKTILSYMSVIFNDSIEVNCNIIKGKYGLWVGWPSIKEKGKWIKIFDIKDKNLKKEIETALITLYKKKKNDTKLKKE